ALFEPLNKAAETLASIASHGGKNRAFALRSLARSCGFTNFQYDFPPPGGCGVGAIDTFWDACEQQLVKLISHDPGTPKIVLDDADPRVFSGTLQVLSSAHRTKPISLLVQRLSDRDAQIRRAAAYFLTQRPLSPSSYPALRLFLVTASQDMLRWAMFHLRG